jgi:hypothetical protein
MFFVNEVKASRLDKNVVFAAVDNHKTGDYKPYLLRSDDRGRTWRSIAGDLPPRTLIWSVAQDRVKKDLLFAGTEFGIYATLDGGQHWLKLGGGVPTISFRDIEIQERECDLVGASFGRGIYILDDYSPLREINEQALAQESLLFPVKKALLYVPLRPLDSNDKGCLGDGFFTAPNPPFGAVFTYYLKESLKSGAEARREEEKALEKAGKPIAFPGWDRLRREDTEDKPEIMLTVKDEAGQVVRRLSGPAGQGIHRVAWDLRYPPVEPTRLEDARREAWEGPPQGPLVVPGSFTVSLSKRAGGMETELGQPQAFDVESLGLASLAESDRLALLGFQKKAGELQRAMMGTNEAARDALRSIQFMKKALMDTPRADPQLGQEASSLETRLRDALRELVGDRTVRRRSEATVPSLLERVNAQLTTTCPITETAKRDYEIAADAFGTLLQKMHLLIEQDLRALGDKLEAAGAPWTPGRRLPDWKKASQ